MFTKLFLFELHIQFRRPATYLYFAAVLMFSLGTFATGSIPLSEKEHINAPFVLALWCAAMSMILAMIGSSVMGLPIYRDIEYRTQQYYLTYPISEAGYFWGRYLGAFSCLLFIASGMIIGAYGGTLLGPVLGWRYAEQYGTNAPAYYLHPFFTIALPNLFFTASLFYGLVSLTRSVKVIYGGGVLLFLGYFLSFFFLMHDHSATVVNLADPFAINGVMLQANEATVIQKNSSLIAIRGTFLVNRLLWIAIGLAILFSAYGRFSFGRFFKEQTAKKLVVDTASDTPVAPIPNVHVSFNNPYSRRIVVSLVKTEWLNLVTDNYFWIILASGVFFLLLAFGMGVSPFGIPEFPRTVLLFTIFNDTFPFYIFLFLLFYTGEIVHRERSSGFAVINDTLPPSNRLLNAAKLLTLLTLGMSMALIPVICGLSVQIAQGFYQFNFGLYATQVFVLLLPRFIQIVIFCYVVHVLVNQKFVGHTIGLLLWLALFFLNKSGTLDYHLLLYGITPTYQLSDMDGLGHMLVPVSWFNTYWLLFGGLLIILSALGYNRGISSTFKDRFSLATQRFDKTTKCITLVVLAAFLIVGIFIYYNVSYLNNYLTQHEQTERKVRFETVLKQFAGLPLPKVTRIRSQVDLYPAKQQALTHAWVTIQNKTKQPITQLLVDGEELTDFRVKTGGKAIPYTYPLYYPRGLFNFFRPAREPAEYRLYQFEGALLPGDSLLLEVQSWQGYPGFRNDTYAETMLHNGTFFQGGLPSLGYDAFEELTDPFERRRYHLPKKNEPGAIPQDDPAGRATLKAGPTIDLLKLDITVSTSADQTALAPGTLVNQWKQNGRNYFQYTQTDPGLYMPISILSARYAVLQDTVQLDHSVAIAIYYHPQHAANIIRFMAAYKDGLHYFSQAYGEYPFKAIRLAETNVYQNKITSLATLDAYTEDFAWNAHVSDPNQFDYTCFRTARTLAQQWWRFQVAPNNTVGSLIIPEGLATYSALALMEKKYGATNMRAIVLDQLTDYHYRRARLNEPEQPLMTMNFPQQSAKAGVVLYGLKNLIGEDRLNAALHAFKQAYAFKNKPPYAGNDDLYEYLQKHVPDSLAYYLADNWLRVTLYDNKILAAKAIPIEKNEYQVTFSVHVAKTVLDKTGKEVPAPTTNDYIDLGVFARGTMNKAGRRQTNPLYVKRYKLQAGTHTISVKVKGRPEFVGIDPYATLLDRNAGNNLKRFN
ncbi:ABC transporter permease/M1 family aminopeptidase [Spirosoma lituiforme]